MLKSSVHMGNAQKSLSLFSLLERRVAHSLEMRTRRGKDESLRTESGSWTRGVRSALSLMLISREWVRVNAQLST